MTEVHKGLESKEISVPDNVVAVSVCQKTGKRASRGCGYAHAEYFISGTEPTKYCNNAGGSPGTKDEQKGEKANEGENKPSAGGEAGEAGEAGETGAGSNEPIKIDEAPPVVISPDTHVETVPNDTGGDVITLE